MLNISIQSYKLDIQYPRFIQVLINMQIVKVLMMKVNYVENVKQDLIHIQLKYVIDVEINVVK